MNQESSQPTDLSSLPPRILRTGHITVQEPTDHAKSRQLDFEPSHLDKQTLPRHDRRGFPELRVVMGPHAHGSMLIDGLSVSLMQDRVELHLSVSDCLAEVRVQENISVWPARFAAPDQKFDVSSTCG